MNANELYIELKSEKYDVYPYERREKLGDDMETVREVIDGYWRERFLINNTDKKAYELMDKSLNLTFISAKDVDWGSVDKLDNNNSAYSFSAYYPRFMVEQFKDGVSLVEWTLYPDGRYFMDEDGFGMEDNDDTTIYGYIDTHANVVIPFQSKPWEELKSLRTEAERRAKEHKEQKK